VLHASLSLLLHSPIPKQHYSFTQYETPTLFHYR
jgi:hypothetical protein